MAIVKMKRISLIALKKDKEKLMSTMQRMGCVEVTDVPEEIKEFSNTFSKDLEISNAKVQRLAWAIDRVKKYDTAGKAMFGCLPEVSQEDADEVFKKEDELFALVSKLEAFEKRLGEMRGIQTRSQAYLDQLELWTDLDITKAQIESMRFVRTFIGLVPQRTLESVKEFVKANPATLTLVGEQRENAAVMAVAHVSCAEEMEKVLVSAGFNAEVFAQLEPTQTPKQAIEEIKKEMEQMEQEKLDMEKQTQNIAQSLPDLKLLYDQLQVKVVRLQTEKKTADTQSAFYVTGWIPAHLEEKAQKKLMSISPVCSVEFTEPLDSEEPPIKLQNNRAATPFESVIEGFAMPAYRSYDPTAIMAPFYACLFGMMVSDAGYGILMALFIPLFIKIKKIKFENAKMLNLLAWGGLATVIWGVIYNTFFGFNPLPRKLWLLDPVGDSLTVMIVCIGVGALHLFAGLFVAAYMNIKKGDVVAAISDQFSWFILLLGLMLLLIPQTAMVGQYMAIVGVVIILLMAGRDRKNPIKRLTKGLGDLYGITSWVSDLLSYMRLFGMGLATGVIGMVFNQLISMVWETGVFGMVIGVVLFVVCHMFNLAINVLGAYVHSCRLQYIEFFGKFYEEGGKPFKPLNTKTKYVSIKQDVA